MEVMTALSLQEHCKDSGGQRKSRSIQQVPAIKGTKEDSVTLTLGYIVQAVRGSTAQWLKAWLQGFPGGAVVENLPANAGDMGSSPGPGRSHMPRSN